MKNISKIILIFAAATLISCEKIIEFKGKETTPMLVVNSFIQPDSTIIVEVSQSNFFLAENTVKFIKNADVQLFINGEMVEKLLFYEQYYFPDVIDEDGDTLLNEYYSPRKNVYVSERKVQAGDNVKIQVSAPNFEKSVWGETVVPNFPQIIDLKTEFITNAEYYNENIKFTLKFKDDETEQNYYRLVLCDYMCFGECTDEYPKVYRYNTYDFVSDDIVFNNKPEILPFDDNYMKYVIFSDEFINGKEHSLSFTQTNFNIVRVYDYETGEYHIYGKNIAFVKLQSISKDYYLFLKTMNAAYNESMTGFFSEPAQVYSNINGGGIGIVGAFAESATRIRFE